MPLYAGMDAFVAREQIFPFSRLPKHPQLQWFEMLQIGAIGWVIGGASGTHFCHGDNDVTHSQTTMFGR